MPDVDVEESLADSARMSAAARRLRAVGPNAVRTHKASGTKTSACSRTE